MATAKKKSGGAGSKPGQGAKASSASSVGLQLSLGAGTDQAELDELTRLLRDELLELDVEEVDLVGDGAQPKAAKGFGLLAVGGLIVKFVGSTAFANVVAAVTGWLGRNKGRTAKIVIDGQSIELSGLSAAQQQELIDTFARRVGGGKTSQ
jgi:hypothetical protein